MHHPQIRQEFVELFLDFELSAVRFHFPKFTTSLAIPVDQKERVFVIPMVVTINGCSFTEVSDVHHPRHVYFFGGCTSLTLVTLPSS